MNPHYAGFYMSRVDVEPFTGFQNFTLPRLNLNSSDDDQKYRQGLSYETEFFLKKTDSSYVIFLECQDE